jgi:hypothetical protein
MINPSQKYKIDDLKTPTSNFDNENKFQQLRSHHADHTPSSGHLMMKKGESFKHQDAKDYYGFGNQETEGPRKKTGKHNEENEEDQNCRVVAECYIGLSKLLNDEMKAFDIKDSVFLDTLKATGTNGGNMRDRINSG